MGEETCRLVTTNNVEVFRLLGAQAVGRLGLDYTVAKDRDDLMRLVRDLAPTVVLVDTELAGGNGFEACATLKADPATAKSHVVLVLDPRRTGGRLAKQLLDRVAASGADDLMALPIHPDDFYYHLAHLTGLPFRRDRRIGVDLEVQFPTPGGTTRGHVVNVGAGGVGVRVSAQLPVGERLAVRFDSDGQQSPDTPLIVAWSRATPNDGGGDDQDLPFAAGLRFDGDPPVKTRLLLEQVALFDVTVEGAKANVILHGDFTEMTRFDALAARLGGATEIEIDLASVRYLSSAGVREWCQFLSGLPAGATYRFRHCSIAFATQAAMVPLVLGEGLVMSLEAPYFCESCDREDLRLLEPGVVAHDGDRLVPPRLHCAACSGELVFDDVPERYFAFLKD
ncbi:MAG TPA: PilZ domain-containing protein [Kofleriaceae bacterium]|nr:PilZ domain-containing protein [Kofleriaceae bacterium]